MAYQKEFPERAQRLKIAVSGLNKQKLVVFDRFLDGDNGCGNDPLIEKMESFSYQDSKKHYQSGRIHLNVNTCDGSKTMFSRRLIELLACGATVIDITNHRNVNLLSRFVYQVATKREFEKVIRHSNININYQFLVDNYSVNCLIERLKFLTKRK